MTEKIIRMMIMGIFFSLTVSQGRADTERISDSQARLLYQQLQKAESELTQAQREIRSIQTESARRDAELTNLKAVQKINDEILSKLKESQNVKSILQTIPRWLGL
jgi:septal ring factor EnvC (AmiA/AmiB activator)